MPTPRKPKKNLGNLSSECNQKPKATRSQKPIKAKRQEKPKASKSEEPPKAKTSQKPSKSKSQQKRKATKSQKPSHQKPKATKGKEKRKATRTKNQKPPKARKNEKPPKPKSHQTQGKKVKKIALLYLFPRGPNKGLTSTPAIAASTYCYTERLDFSVEAADVQKWRKTYFTWRRPRTAALNFNAHKLPLQNGALSIKSEEYRNESGT